MELITTHDILSAAFVVAKTYFEINGIFAQATVRLVLQPFYTFNLFNVLAAAGGVIMLWRKKGWIFSGLSHMFQIAEWLSGRLKND